MAKVEDEIFVAADSTALIANGPPPIKTKYQKCIIGNVVVLLIMLLIIIGVVLALGGAADPKTKAVQQNVNKLHFITRDEWIAQPPDNKLTKLALPVNRVIIQHSGTEGCLTQTQCVYRVRLIQSYHMESKHWDDIGSNFLVGGDGAVYEGRGWYFQGAHTKGYNAGTFGIAFIGTFTKNSPPQRQFNALRAILEEGVRLGKLTKDYKMYPHRAFFGTESPGDKVIEVLKTWPHYVGTFDEYIDPDLHLYKDSATISSHQ